MKIGYLVQGTTDQAFLEGLRRRWCPVAEFVMGHTRGSINKSLQRDTQKIFEELVLKSVDVIICLTDSDDRPWQDVKKEVQGRFPPGRLELAIVGVPDRNIECWICRDAAYVAGVLRIPAGELVVGDPKGRFESAMGMDGVDRKENEIADLVKAAPLHLWLRDRSFEDFYEQVRDISQRRGCTIENLRQ